MSNLDARATRRIDLPTVFLTVVLACAAALHLGFLAWIGLDSDDTENLESTLVLLASRQLTDGFAGLYGPYTGRNPGVIIQAPLYYRLTALLAAPWFRLGMDPVDACRLAGRMISLVSLYGLFAVVSAMTRIGGESRRAGLWAVLILAGSTAIGSFPVSMRPDVMGVFLQSLGLYLTLLVLSKPDSNALGRLVVAFASFGLALCTKQHYMAGPVFATLVLGFAAVRRRLSWQALIAAEATALVVLLGYYGIEDVLTGGMMRRSVFLLPMELKAIVPGSWAYVGFVFLTAGKHAFGLLAVGAACVLATSRRSRGERLETLLLAFIALDLILMAKLCLNSAGGWYNYALEAAVCASVLIGRGIDRVQQAERATWWRLGIVGAAAMMFLASDVRRVARGVAFRRQNQVEAVALLNSPAVFALLPEQRYFSGSIQHYNLRYGDRRLTHDEWLYSAFETIGAAEPRTAWLREVVESGQVRLVVLTDESTEPSGLGASLPQLGYAPAGMVGPFHLWVRSPQSHVAARGTTR